MTSTTSAATQAAGPKRRARPAEFNVFLGLVGIALIFEALGWIFQGQSFLINDQRLQIMILQVSVIGIIAVGVTQVIITGGIDLSSGSIVGATAMIAMSFAQVSTYARAAIGLAKLTSLPPNQTLPPVRCSTPVIWRTKVDLPAPLSPTTAMCSPSRRVKFASSSACTPP